MALIVASLNWETMMRNTAAYLFTDWYYYATNPDREHDYNNRQRDIKQLADAMLVLARKGSVEVKTTLAQVWNMPGMVFEALIVAPDADVACALVRNKTVCGEDLSRAVKYGGVGRHVWLGAPAVFCFLHMFLSKRCRLCFLLVASNSIKIRSNWKIWWCGAIAVA